MITVPPGAGTPSERVSRWLAGVFTYVRDIDNPLTDQVPEQWPPRSQIESELASTGRIVDDCDGHAYAAVYALGDLGVKARVVTCFVPVAPGTDGAFERNGKWVAGHMVAEDDRGWVLDNMNLGVLMTWPELQSQGIEKNLTGGFSEFEDGPRWTKAL